MKAKRTRASVLLLFLVPLVSLGQTQPRPIPAPAEFLGFSPGTTGRLADYESIAAYFNILNQRSPRLRVQELGFTHEGRPLILAIITAPANIDRMPYLIETQRRLADPREIIDAQARRLVENAKTIVSINCSIHAQEIGPSQMSMELAYRLTASDTPEIADILEKTVLLLIPAHNPDGLNRVVEWYDEHKGTEWEAGPLPFLGHPICGHDINRDWFNLTQRETQLTVEKVYNVWRPHIVFDLHQMGSFGARMFVPPYVDPYDGNIDPIVQAEMAELGTAIASELTALGRAGLAFNVYYDSYSPARTYTNYHGGVRILGEIASARLASPIRVEPERMKKSADFDPLVRSWNHPMPWSGGEWRLEDIVSYSLDASFALLKNAAYHRTDYVKNAYRMAKEAVAPDAEKPIFLIPPDQNDRSALYALLSRLADGLVEINRAEEDFVIDETIYPAGTFVIFSAQPYGTYVRTLLGEWPYPSVVVDEKRMPLHPYDLTTHHLPLLFGVKVISVKGDYAIDFKKLNQIEPVQGTIRGSASHRGLILDYRNGQVVTLLQKLYAQNAQLYWLSDSLLLENTVYPPGTIYAKSDNIEEIAELAASLSIDAVYSPEPSDLRYYRLSKPRIGLYRSYRPRMDEGWTRYVLESHDIDYAVLENGDIVSADLVSQFDVIVLPDQRADDIVNGVDEGSLPPEYCGGIGANGIERLREFVQSGGSLVCFGSSTELPIQHFWLGVKNVVKDLSKSEYYAPGALVKVIVDTREPLGFGLPRETAALNVDSPAFELTGGRTIAFYPGEDILLNGWLTGEDHIALKAAVAEVPYGRGSVVLMGIRPQFRAQMLGTFKFLFNALIKSAATPAWNRESKQLRGIEYE